MRQAYHVNGEPFASILCRASSISQNHEMDIHEARDLVARDLGCQDFQEMSDGAIYVDAEMRAAYSFERKLGIDRVIFDFEHLLRKLCGLGNKRLSRRLPVFGVETSVTSAGKTASGENTLIHWVTFKSFGKDKASAGDLQEFKPKGNATIGDLNDAFRSFWKGKSSDLVAHLYQEGFLDLQLARANIHGDPDALLEIELRKHALTLGDRKVFNKLASEVPTEGLFSECRIFINTLPNGKLVISNGTSSRNSLKWKVLSTEELNSTISQMKADLGDEALTEPEGELWLLKKCFGIEDTSQSDRTRKVDLQRSAEVLPFKSR